jgi:hypothetical protein
MGVRERLNENPRGVAAVVVGVLLLAGTFAAFQFLNADTTAAASDRAFFSTDDGKTWFVDNAGKLPPFERDGKEAVRAYVFECKGKQFVNHLERYTPDGRRAAEAALESQRTSQTATVPAQLRLAGAEVRKPGAKQWAPLGDLAKAGPILRPKCPDGNGDPTPVEP